MIRNRFFQGAKLLVEYFLVYDICHFAKWYKSCIANGVCEINLRCILIEDQKSVLLKVRS